MKDSSTLPLATPGWEQELARAYRSAADLAEAGLIPAGDEKAYAPLLARYKFLLPRYYAGLIDPADPACPIRRQAIPALDELAAPADGWSDDPLRDLAHRPAPRITHRYEGRVLLHLTPNCSMYCRYCFRKTLLNELKEELFEGALAESLAYVRGDASIGEVIFSGGDPFLVRDAQLAPVLAALAAIPHVRRVRFHTRVPVTFPVRVTDALAATLAATRLPVVVVTHFNHARELTPWSRAAVKKLAAAGARLLNQSVLLAGVNDSADALADLSEGLFDAGVLPYYLHHPDRAAGTAHFDLPRERGTAIHADLKRRLPGYLVPRYVWDDIASPYKRDV